MADSVPPPDVWVLHVDDGVNPPIFWGVYATRAAADEAIIHCGYPYFDLSRTTPQS